MTPRRWLAAGVVVVLLIGGALWFVSDAERLLGLVVARERSAGGLEQLTVQIDDHRIVYLDGGDPDGETVLLLHGFAADKDNWTRFSATLKDAGYRVLAPDLPGHGESSRVPTHTYDIPNQVAFVEAFVVAQGLEQVHIAGNSMGGHIAGAYAALHPQRVQTLGLLNAGGVKAPEQSEREKIMEETGTNPLLVESVEDFDRLLAFVFVEPPKLPRVVKQYFADRAVINRAFNDKIYGDLSGAGRLLPLEPLLPQVTAPALILWGDSDRLLHPSGADVFAAGLPDSETVIMRACGHSPMVERPAETAEIYVDFLERRSRDDAAGGER